MSSCSELATHEKIATIQSQLRIAMRNHQLLVLRKKSSPMDQEIENHIGVIQWLIVNMGRTQAQLLSQFKNEIAQKYNLKPNAEMVNSILKGFLSWNDVPKNIPVFKYSMRNDEKRISSWKTKAMKSVLRINNDGEKPKIITTNSLKPIDALSLENSKVKVVYNSNKKKDNQSPVLVTQTKKLQSVLKSKNLKSNDSPCWNGSEDGRPMCASPGSSSSSSCEGKSRRSPARSESPSDEVELVDMKNKIETRYGKKYESKIMGKPKVKFLCDGSNSSKKELLSEHDIRNDFPPDVKEEVFTPISLDDVSQEMFLSFFGLISIEKSEAVKRKRCERKRRSVAGQSSFYSDYFQPQPKRTYTPRRPLPAPAASNAVIVEPAIINDDEDEKPTKQEICAVCQEDGALETCNSCSEMYHSTCIAETVKGCCPTCSGHPTNIPSIVGAKNSAGSASNSELIKRYSNDDSNDPATSEPKPSDSADDK